MNKQGKVSAKNNTKAQQGENRKFRGYKNYKPSGVEWLGDVPKHWEVKRTSFLFQIMKKIAGTDGIDVLSITQKGLKVKDIESNDGQLALDYSKYQIVNIGDFAMNQMDLLTGFVDIAKMAGVTSPDYRVFKIKNPKSTEPRFYLYIFQLCYFLKIYYDLGQGVSGFGRWRLPREQFNNFILPMPTLPEQHAIASFLDRETGRIDALIAKKQRLLELLAEQRTALISRAVTKGLDAAVKLKHSRIEWLGDVPEHWEVKAVKYLIRILTDFTANGSFASLAENVTYLSEGYSRLIRLTDLRDNLFNDGIYVDEEAHKYLKKSELFTDDILMANVGAYTGFVCKVPRIDYKATLGPNMYLLRFKSTVHPNYILYLLSSDTFFKLFQLKAMAAAQPKMNKDDVKETIICLPPLCEQQAIASYLDRETAKIDALSEKVKAAIEKLKEYRTALISAAVTGKIDVREAV